MGGRTKGTLCPALAQQQIHGRWEGGITTTETWMEVDQQLPHVLYQMGAGGPGVVKLRDYFESPAQSVIVTEYLEGNEQLEDDVQDIFPNSRYIESDTRRLLSGVFRLNSPK